MKLNIVTPVTRPQNLPAIRESIRQQLGKGVDIAWWVIFDCKCPMPEDGWKDQLDEIENQVQATITGIAGHCHRNTILIQQELRARIESPDVLDEWFMSLDDDNILHPRLIPYLAKKVSNENWINVAVFDQEFRNGHTRLLASPDTMKLGNVDTAQYLFRFKCAQGMRFDEKRYDADGLFIERLYEIHNDSFHFVYRPLCYYNYLRS